MLDQQEPFIGKGQVDKRSQSIGIFDSGVGGLTVMRCLIEQLPREDIVYFGDTARVPYGNKSPQTIIRYALENTAFLMESQIKCLVVACNSVSAYAMEKLCQTFQIPIVDVITPVIKKALSITKSGNIAVLGTRATISSGIYERLILEKLKYAALHSLACPLFVPLVEEGYVSHPISKMVISDHLSSLKGKNIDTVILGCTHYPLLTELIQEELGEAVVIVDSAGVCAEAVSKALKENDLENSMGGVHHYFSSDDPERFRFFGERFLGREICRVISSEFIFA